MSKHLSTDDKPENSLERTIQTLEKKSGHSGIDFGRIQEETKKSSARRLRYKQQRNRNRAYDS